MILTRRQGINQVLFIAATVMKGKWRVRQKMRSMEVPGKNRAE
jgi:hypothetical protein